MSCAGIAERGGLAVRDVERHLPRRSPRPPHAQAVEVLVRSPLNGTRRGSARRGLRLPQRRLRVVSRKTEVDHLPELQQRELARVREILLEEIDKAISTATNPEKRNGKVDKKRPAGSYRSREPGRAVEATEKRIGAQLAREIEFAIPPRSTVRNDPPDARVCRLMSLRISRSARCCHVAPCNRRAQAVRSRDLPRRPIMGCRGYARLGGASADRLVRAAQPRAADQVRTG